MAPRFSRVVQDDRVVAAVVRALRMRGDIEDGFNRRVESLAETLNLATKRDIGSVKRDMRRVVRELAHAKREAAAAKAALAALTEAAADPAPDP